MAVKIQLGSRHIQHCVPCHALVLSSLFIFLQISFATATSAANVPVDVQIQRVISNIPPPVLVVGEPNKKTSLAELMAKLHVPGVSIAVIRGGRLVWASGFGVIRNGGPRVNQNTLFQASSISKPITALAILRLVDIGTLNLNKDVNQYLSSWSIPISELTSKHKVTLRELLSHTAGVTVAGFGGYASGRPLPSLQQILDGAPPANNPPIQIDIQPGTAARYSGGGYVIVRQVLEDVTHQPFKQVMKNLVLNPIGMAHSSFDQPLSARWQSNAAMPGNREGKTLVGGARIYPELAPDGLWTTPTDLARDIIAIQRSLAGKSGSLLKPEMAREMLTQRLDHFGLGVVVGDDNKHPWFGFNGGNYGFPSLFVAFANGEGAVIMSNGQNGYKLELGILRSIAQVYGWPDFQPVTYPLYTRSISHSDSYMGAYETSSGSLVVITRNKNRLFIQTAWQGQQQLLPMSQHKFFIKHVWPDYLFNRDDGEDITFKRNAHGKIENIEFSNSHGTIISAKRMPAAAAKTVIRLMAEINHRFQRQIPAKGSETLLRQLIPGLAAETPDYGRMTPQLAKQVKAVVNLDKQIFALLGPLQSMTFLRTSSTGIDTYHLKFKNGTGEMDIALQENGKARYLLWFPD